MKSQPETKQIRSGTPLALSEGNSHGQIVLLPEEERCLDTAQLNRLEQSFREWVNSASRTDQHYSRQRILLIFLLIRYTGAKLNEVLALNPFEAIDPVRHTVLFRGNTASTGSNPREVQVSETLSDEIQVMLEDASFSKAAENVLAVDPGYVRRKFYERAQACGFSKRLGGPETIRKARAVELMQGNMPLPAVQMMLGHSTPNLTSAYVSFSQDDMRQVAKLFLERESMRKTSARNTFFGKIHTTRRGDIQTLVELTTMEGHSISTVITNDSVEKLGLKPGRLITAEVKAPWIILQGGKAKPACSAENLFQGIITKLTGGEVNTECVVRISDGLDLCAVVSTAGSRQLELKEGDSIWVLFSCFSVVLHVD
jgi:molybdate transport system regulatory protein